MKGARDLEPFKKLDLKHYDFNIFSCWKLVKGGCKPCER